MVLCMSKKNSQPPTQPSAFTPRVGKAFIESSSDAPRVSFRTTFSLADGEKLAKWSRLLSHGVKMKWELGCCSGHDNKPPLLPLSDLL